MARQPVAGMTTERLTQFERKSLQNCGRSASSPVIAATLADDSTEFPKPNLVRSTII
jgi:hypothetical protein